MFFQKRLLATVCLSAIAVSQSFAGKAPSPAPKRYTIKPPPLPANARTIQNLPGFPLWHLKTSVRPNLYKALLISPVTAWVVVQVSDLAGAEPKLVRSDAGGVFDKLAKEMAKGWGAVGYNTTESRVQHPTLSVHLLIYKIADGLMAVTFSHDDQAFYAGQQYSDVWVGVYKDGNWTRVGGTRVVRNLPQPHL